MMSWHLTSKNGDWMGFNQQKSGTFDLTKDNGDFMGFDQQKMAIWLDLTKEHGNSM